MDQRPVGSKTALAQVPGSLFAFFKESARVTTKSPDTAETGPSQCSAEIFRRLAKWS